MNKEEFKDFCDNLWQRVDGNENTLFDRDQVADSMGEFYDLVDAVSNEFWVMHQKDETYFVLKAGITTNPAIGNCWINEIVSINGDCKKNAKFRSFGKGGRWRITKIEAVDENSAVYTLVLLKDNGDEPDLTVTCGKREFSRWISPEEAHEMNRMRLMC